jgi:hypothetical protein
MAQTAAHMVDQVLPPLPVRQWVLSVPKRLRYFLQHHFAALGAVLHILLRVIEARLRQRSGCARGRLGAVSFVQRFGSALNAPVHFHCCVIDGVFAEGEGGQVQLAEAGALTPEDFAAVEQQVRAGAALVRPCRPSRSRRCARDGELGPRRGFLAPAAALNAGKAGVSLR